MLSLENIAAVKTAIVVCNDPNLKNEILCAPGSDYDLNIGEDRDTNKLRWYETVEKKILVLLGKSGLPKQLQEKVTSLVFSVGMTILLWAEYQKGLIGLPGEYCVNFLKNSFFTPKGLINNKKAAEELMKEEGLNIGQKFKLACLYCFTEHIPVLFKKITNEDKKKFYDAESPRRIKQPELVKFWSYYLMGEIDKLKGERNIDQYRLKSAVRSGSKTAVEYCLEKTKLRTKLDAVIVASVEAVGCRISVKPHADSDQVFGKRYLKEELWVPSDYYVDILSFLFPKMGYDQQMDLLKREIEVIETERDYYKRVVWALMEGERIEKKHSEKGFILLEYFLNWPYQDYFMKIAKLTWEFLPESYYASLLLMICDKIEFRYGEGKTFDYRKLFKEFWCQSPDRYKRFTFENQYVTFRTYADKKRVASCVGLLTKLLTINNFTYEDEEIIKLVLTSATAEEKENILSTQEWTSICAELMVEEKWETLDRYTLYFFSSKERTSKYKKALSFREKPKTVCIDFARNDNWDAAESFIKWSSLPEEEIKKLKEEMINSWHGFQSCVEQILFDKKGKAVDKFIRWYIPSEENVKAFKKKLIHSDYGKSSCASSVRDEQELVTELINFCLSSEGEVKEFKKKVAYEYGGQICTRLISLNYYCSDWTYKRFNFYRGEWEEVEKFLTWCFSSEEKINDFKKNNLLKEYGEEIHFELIESTQFEEAETFFAWLGLSVEGIKELKKRTLFDYSEARDVFRDLILKEDEEIFADYGSQQEAIELLLRWFLTDTEMVLECKDKFLKYLHQDIEEGNEDNLKSFNLMIEQRLKDLDDENKGAKRTLETFPLNKRLCTH